MTDELALLQEKRRRTVIQILIRMFFIAVGIYVIFGALLYTFQRDFMYAATRLGAVGTPAEEGVTGVSDVKFLTVDGLQLHAWFAPARDFGKPTILFFHGNGTNIKRFTPKAQFYLARGYGVFQCEYRGYGGNPGQPTEQGLYHDAEACLFALKEKGYGPWNLVYYGESLGSGVAVDLAVRYPPKSLILESAYSSTVDVAKLIYWWFPVDWMMKDRFDSFSKIDKVTSRIFVVHGEADTFIPFTQGTKLFDKANQPKEFYAVAGGHHGDLYKYGAGDVIAAWLGHRRVSMYVPTKAYAGAPDIKGMGEVTLSTEDHLWLHAWFAPPKQKGGKIIVYFHGNRGNLADLRPVAKAWIDRGYGVYLCEYRGYGGNSGNPSEEGLYRDARAGLVWLKSQGYDAKQYIYYGYSIGAAVAVQMATETAPELLVLEAGGSNVLDVINAQRPTLTREVVGEFVNERFESLDKMPKIHVPVLFMHGEKDDVVPIRFGRKLFDAANEPKTFKSFPEASHRDLSTYGAGDFAAEWIKQNSGSTENATAQ